MFRAAAYSEAETNSVSLISGSSRLQKRQTLAARLIVSAQYGQDLVSLTVASPLADGGTSSFGKNATSKPNGPTIKPRTNQPNALRFFDDASAALKIAHKNQKIT
jgi:hypothetical protein